ncbi:uncharacterized protein LOC106468805 [Limulus polyphemus]|uniref:Uncharacterized protein LOC106468805 n=1 Tax=Limulus polyphemus TaxID=6850 RepID=A0ABM1BM09_LIMPO|nr:uncharacterized protein LOC106468805 [Limulus polyphemus]
MEEPTRMEESHFDTLYSYNNVPMLEQSPIAYGSLQADALDYSGDDDGNSMDPTNEFGSAFTSTAFVEQRAKKRRKQSNPVRYHTTQVPDTDEREELASAISDEALNLKIKHQNTSKESDKNPESLLKCHHCSSLFQSEELLRVHVEEEHVQKLLEKQLHQQSHNKSTSLNSREASSSESQGNSESVRTTEASSFTLFNDQRLSTMPISYASTSSLGSRDFTKNSLFPSMPPLIPISHSADGKPSNMSLSLNMFPNSIAPFLFPVLPQLQGQNSAAPNSSNPSNRIFNPEAYCEMCNKEFCNKYFLKTHKANKHAIYSVESLVSPSYPGTFISNNLTNPIPLPPPLLQNLPTRPPTPQQGIMNIEAYCEICQKEFCNKYFLKKHKYRIHGIEESQKISGTSDNNAISPEKNNTSPAALRTESSKHTFSTSFSVQNNICFNQNMLPKPSSSVETVTTSATNSTNKTLLPPKEDSSNSEKGATTFTPDKLREIGVINADAFCELCCKEFCNKYFLRIHRIKKHSINISESSSKDGQSGGENTYSPVLSEAGQVLPSSSIPGTVLQESHSKQEDVYVCGPGGVESVCELCNRPFASLYLLKMHMFYTHNIPQVKEEENSKPNSPADPQQPLTSSSVNCTTTEVSQQQVTSSTSFPEESSGQDLQRLQTMIKELNAPLRINDNRVACGICSLQFDSKYYLRAHMMNEHGFLLNEDGYSATSLETQKITDHIMHFKQSLFHPLPSPPSVAVHDVEASCEICQKKFSSKYFLRVHKQNTHNIPVDDNSGTCDQSSLKSPQPVSTSKPIPSPTINNKTKVLTGSNFCNICNKELCNKYFMKTHMLKMHGVDLNEQPTEAAKISTIGGVTCDVCQKELCSKYFLKVHKQNTHGIYEEPPPNKESSCQSSFQLAGSSNQNLLPGELVDSRHFSHYTEICPLCDRRFKSIKWLKTHIINDHNSAKKDILSSPENVGINEMAAVCVICGQSFADQVALQVHLIKDHRTSTEELGITSNSGMKITQDSSGVMIQDQLDNPVNGSVSPRATSMSLDFLEGKEGETKLHHCSYCTYTTRWLSNLYAHEKRHTTMIVEGEKKFFCRICHRAYRYSHSLQRHLLSHRTVGFSAKDLTHPQKTTSQIFTQTNGEQKKGENIQNENGHNQVKPRIKVKRYRCSKCDKKFRTRELCLAHIHAFHNSKKLVLNQQKVMKPFHCPACGFIARAWNMLKLHINKQHENSPEILRRAEIQHSLIPDASILTNRQFASESLTEPVLREFPFQPDLPSTGHGTHGQPPMSYAMPHSPHTTGTFIMQPFFLAQPEMDGNIKNDNFVPSLVYLPVCQKISQPMTVAFSLTPA